MRLHTPAQLAALTGLSVGNQRAWRANGIFQNRGTRSKGGHWRFADADVLFVSVVRAINTLGIELAVASTVANLVLGEIAGSISGDKLLPIEQTHPYIFIWNMRDTNKEFVREIGDISGIPGTEYCVFRLANLARITAISNTGGFLLVPSGLINRLPQAVIDLFQEKESSQ